MKFLFAFFLVIIMIFASMHVPASAAEKIAFIELGNVKAVSGGNHNLEFPKNTARTIERDNTAQLVDTGKLRMSKTRADIGDVPGKKNALLNPDHPLEITSVNDKIIVGFGSDIGEEHEGIFAIRILDHEGEVVARTTSRDTPIELDLKSASERFYIEFRATVNAQSVHYDSGMSLGLGIPLIGFSIPLRGSRSQVTTQTVNTYCYVLVDLKQSSESLIDSELREMKKQINQ